MNSASCSTGGQAGKSIDKTRRCWSQHEEEVLIAGLKELITIGWKGDNGFKPGYLNKLEQYMKKVFPNTDLKGQPHINSKITGWKKSYGSLVTMLGRTGVGFSHVTKLIECNDETWDLVVQKDSNARTMRFKKWTFFGDWTEIFGKDRATGETAEDLMDAVNAMVNEVNHSQPEPEKAGHENINVVSQFDDTEGNSVAPTERNDVVRRTKKKKRNSADDDERLYDILSQLCRNTTERLDTIARALGYEYDLGKARKSVFDLVANEPGLTLDEKLDIAEVLASKPECMEMFTGLPEDARARYVRRLLGSGRP